MFAGVAAPCLESLAIGEYDHAEARDRVGPCPAEVFAAPDISDR